jgi:hypothetical protein
MNHLLLKSGHIFDYIKTKKYVETYMQIKPQQTLVELHVEGMGLSMGDRTKKECFINLSQGISQAQMLGLAYYSMRLSSIFHHEGFIANQIYNSLRFENDKPMSLDKLYVEAKQFADLMKNEHLYDVEYDMEKFR